MNKHYHFVGIGGIGMSALAVLLLDKGCKVTGSDLRMNQVTERLREHGAHIFAGHDHRNIKDAACVVYSSAVGEDNEELVAAKKKKIPVVQRAKLLAQIMEDHTGITVAGAHGKTTTTSMIAHLLVRAGFHPTTAIGGIVRGSQTHARLGKGEYFVAEVDESDGSFLCFSPTYSVITNIDFEHIDYYQDWEHVFHATEAFLGRTVPGGLVLACGDDGHLLKLLKASRQLFKTYGFLPHNDIRATNVAFDQFESRFECYAGRKNLGQVFLKIPGRHNVANALACIGLGLSLSIDFDTICESLKRFEGVQRRFQLVGRKDDVWVIDDYAHHPTEIRATLETARLFKQSLPGKDGRIICVFQPHRYTRVKGLMEEFAESLIGGDHVIITDIYAAGEKPISGATPQNLCKRISAKANKPVDYCPQGDLVDYLTGIVKPKDIVLTLGAGDITRIAGGFAAALKKQSSVIEQA